MTEEPLFELLFKTPEAERGLTKLKAANQPEEVKQWQSEKDKLSKTIEKK